MQTVNLKVTSVNDRHVFTTLFMNGVSLGHLIFDHGEYQLLAAAVSMGASKSMGHLVDTSDSHVFDEWAEKEAK